MSGSTNVEINLKCILTAADFCVDAVFESVHYIFNAPMPVFLLVLLLNALHAKKNNRITFLGALLAWLSH